MLSYKHGYHAGNYADILKHLSLNLLIDLYQKKDKGFLYLDTHAGSGVYNLKSEIASKTAEYKLGIELLYNNQFILDNINSYLEIINSFNKRGSLVFYPGSPFIAASKLRTQDRMVLSELHPNENILLNSNFKNKKDVKVQILKQNGLDTLKSHLPPLERRGIILIDPSYEVKNDYNEVFEKVQLGYKKFSTGCFAIWYPILNSNLYKKMIKNLESITDEFLNIEFYYDKKVSSKMYGNGMFIINPPYKFKETLTQDILELQKVYKNSSFKIL
ncbi:MAG: 23S rRNA (adenine(2030)-N(6))-methyltransferase RlmJ [Psittacicella sp.]